MKAKLDFTIAIMAFGAVAPLCHAAELAYSTPEQRAPWSASKSWSRAGADPGPWLMLDLGSAKAFREIFIQEHHSGVRRFVVEFRQKATGPWTPIVLGRRLNYLSYRMARPTAARCVRIRFPQTQGSAPQVSRFEVYASR